MTWTHILTNKVLELVSKLVVHSSINIYHNYDSENQSNGRQNKYSYVLVRPCGWSLNGFMPFSMLLLIPNLEIASTLIRSSKSYYTVNPRLRETEFYTKQSLDRACSINKTTNRIHWKYSLGGATCMLQIIEPVIGLYLICRSNEHSSIHFVNL